MAELFAAGTLEELNEFELGIITAAIVFEPRKNQHMLSLSKTNRNIKRICEKLYEEIKARETHYRIHPFSKQPYFHLSGCMESWLRGTSFDKILQFTDTDEGEVVRYFRMSIQILREINAEQVASNILRERIKETISVINRDVVDAQKQLRIA